MNRDELKPGDEVLVKGTVKSFWPRLLDCVVITLKGSGDCHVSVDAIVSRAPRPLQIGDKVITSEKVHGTLVGIDEGRGWIKLSGGVYFIRHLSELAHAPD